MKFDSELQKKDVEMNKNCLFDAKLHNKGCKFRDKNNDANMKEFDVDSHYCHFKISMKITRQMQLIPHSLTRSQNKTLRQTKKIQRKF